MSRDSVYQQLRGHLAYLKLAATAEALPAHLEAARRSDIGHTGSSKACCRGRSHRSPPLDGQDAVR